MTLVNSAYVVTEEWNATAIRLVVHVGAFIFLLVGNLNA